VSGVRHLFVDSNDPLYQAAVSLRYDVFFKPTDTAIDQLYDQHESASLHGVAVNALGELLGYIRFTFHEDRVGRVSQLVIKSEVRGQMAILVGLYRLVIARAKELGLAKLIADVRLPNQYLCERAGFVRVGPPFPSVKTQIPHQRMELDLGPARAEAEARRAL
jgi:hypothetical protein